MHGSSSIKYNSKITETISTVQSTCPQSRALAKAPYHGTAPTFKCLSPSLKSTPRFESSYAQRVHLMEYKQLNIIIGSIPTNAVNEKFSIPGKQATDQLLSAALMASAACNDNVLKLPPHAGLLHHAKSANEWY